MCCVELFNTQGQNAAGTLKFLISSAIPQLKGTLVQEDMPLELTESVVGSLEFLMLAQAQECVWQRAVMGEDNMFELKLQCLK